VVLVVVVLLVLHMRWPRIVGWMAGWMAGWLVVGGDGGGGGRWWL
jgi:hypothetical protein